MAKIVESPDVKFEKRDLTYDQYQDTPMENPSPLDGLVYAVDCESRNKIFVHTPKGEGLLFDGAHSPTTYFMCLNSHISKEGPIIVGGTMGGQVLDILENTIIGERPNKICSMFTLEEVMMDATSDGGIYSTLSNKKEYDYGMKITACCALGKDLVIAQDDVIIVGVSTELLVKQRNRGGNGLYGRERNTSALSVHEKRLYDATGRAIYKTMASNKVAIRYGLIYALCSHRHEIYDGGQYIADDGKDGIYHSFSGEMVIETEGPVTAMASIPPEHLPKVMEKIKTFK